MTKEGVALRRLELPHYLSIEFLKIAEKNTIDGIETCGILCGKIGDGVLRVIALLIPKQQATSNTCTTTNEEEVAFILSDNDWVALGWIHVSSMNDRQVHTSMHFGWYIY
ncbi:STAM-binding protein-like A [Zancudomyces culisetae]|uniref:STAM-binding protein-like A n=1 Tax=Zancudomyces culisetae TaxID=1213189 RepID=A0A1R1PQA5_ZANCU|nr:STAM-binding protein-like A [Zancudomyces culisetae]|eukprot:OMH83144.1 STAM-binding protein-like A [Zancudomyces culisetae]